MTASLESKLTKELQQQKPDAIERALGDVLRAKPNEIDTLPESVRTQVAGVFKERVADIQHHGTPISHNSSDEVFNSLAMMQDLQKAADKLEPPKKGASR
jgi:hypothetical protein